MPSEKINWRKFTHWLSPLLLVSLGLHGLVMLIPLPGKDEPIKKTEVDLPAPMSVTELPKGAKPAPEDGFIPTLAPNTITPLEPSSKPVTQPTPVVTPAPTPPSASTPAPRPTPASTPAPTSNTSTSTPASTPTPPLVTPIAGQPYSVQGTTPTEGRDASLAFLTRNNLLASKAIRKPLSLSYPAAGKCFKETTSPKAVVDFVINKSGAILDAEVTRKTGYSDIDQWLYDAVVDSEDTEDIISNISTIYSGETGEALSPKGEATEAAFEFEVDIAIDGSVCK